MQYSITNNTNIVELAQETVGLGHVCNISDDIHFIKPM